jgi:16S rRNA (cytosine1402-N4)-methyltransferase
MRLAEKGQSSGHEPVLSGPVVAYLAEERSGLFLDATFGGGGHTRAILEADSSNKVVALDCDPEAIERGRELQKSYPGRLVLHHMNFEDLGTLEEDGFIGILFDFGVSSYHFDDAHRGFSFREDAPLDMRLNPEAGQPASQFLKKASYFELVEAVRNFGEEPRWRRIVSAIESARNTDQLERTLAFAKLVEDAVGGRRPMDRIHPATRTFQGVRIAVNRELAVIESALPAAFDKLLEGGRMAAISFHSLEDRIVKRFFRRMAGRPEHGRDSRPGQFRIRQATMLTRKPVVADDEEVTRNPRSRSAKLRVLEKERKAA